MNKSEQNVGSVDINDIYGVQYSIVWQFNQAIHILYQNNLNKKRIL
jgi:hypothetical protein